jgi:hypothetical protein
MQAAGQVRTAIMVYLAVSLEELAAGRQHVLDEL